MRENAERGFFNGGKVPFAYRVERSSEIPGQVRGKLVFGPDDEVNLVREIFEMSVSLGMGVKAIANRLNERGIPAPTTPHWSGSSVSHVLHNAVYAGDSVWFKSKRVGRDGRKTTRAEERTVVRDTHPAIIDRATFEKVKVRAKSRSFEDRKARAKPVGYLLARLIRCDHCGGTFGGRRMNHKLAEDRRSVTFAYYCNSYLNKGKAVCPSFPLSKTWAESSVLDLIRAKLCDPASLAELERLVAERIEERHRRYGQDTTTVTRRIAENQRQIDNLYKAVGMGMDAAGAIPLINELKAKKAELEQEATILAQGNYYADALNTNVELLRRLSETFRETFDELSFEVRRQIILLFVKEIRLVDRKELHVHLRIPFNNRGLKAILESEGEDAGTEKNNAEGAGSTQATSACRSGTRWLPVNDQTDAGTEAVQQLLRLPRALRPDHPPAWA